MLCPRKPAKLSSSKFFVSGCQELFVIGWNEGQAHLETIAILATILAKSIYDTNKDQFYLSLLFLQTKTHGEVSQHNVNQLVFLQSLFLIQDVFQIILTEFLEEDILKPLMSNKLHPWKLGIGQICLLQIRN